MDNIGLADVVKKIINNTSLERLRISSLDPAGIDERLLDIITNEPRIMPHFHLSIQSGDNSVLRAMRRRHTREEVIKLCNNILNIRPDVVFGSDFIAGFPTETESMFENTLKLIDEAHLSLIHVFPFSPRSGTVAAKLIQLPRTIIHERAARLRAKSQQAKKNLFQSLIGKSVSGLVEKSDNGITYGKTNSFIPFITKSKLKPKTIMQGNVKDFDNNFLNLQISESMNHK